LIQKSEAITGVLPGIFKERGSDKVSKQNWPVCGKMQSSSRNECVPSWRTLQVLCCYWPVVC